MPGAVTDALGAFLLVAATAFLATRSRPAREDRLCLYLSLLLLLEIHALGFINALVTPLPGGEVDARHFWQSASTALERGQVPRVDMGAFGYTLLLYGFGLVVSDSLYLMQLTSVLAASGSIALICAISFRLSHSYDVTRIVLALLCLSPGFLLYSFLTLREAIELVSVSGFLALYSFTRRPVMLLAGPVVLFPAAFMHQALLVHSAFIWAIAMLIAMWSAAPGRLRWWVPVAGVAGVAGAAAVAMFYPLVGGRNLLELLDIGILEELAEYRAPIEAAQPNTAHGLALSFDTPASTAASLAMNYLYFMFGPLINFRPSVVYVVLGWEAAVRLLGLPVLLFVAGRTANRREWWFLVLVYVSMTFLWSLATTNDGQAFRHHYLTQWILLIALGTAWVRRKGGGPAARGDPH